MGKTAKTKSLCKFQTNWLSNSDFKQWVKPAPSMHVAKCTVCAKDIDISSMGKQALKSHAAGRIHQERVKAKESSLSMDYILNHPIRSELKEASGSIVENKPGEDRVLVVQPKPPSNLQKYLIGERVTRAEILWALNGVKCHFSNRGIANSVPVMQTMFSDSEVAGQMKLGKDKIGYIINHGLGPFFYQELKEKVGISEFYSVLFDESLNKISQRGQMDLCVRFMDGNLVSTRYLDSVFMGRAASEDLLVAFKQGTAILDHRKILQVSMDGPSVNRKFLRLYDLERSSKLLDIGTCSLHSVNGALKYADDKWRVGNFLSSCFYVFRDSPARRARFLEYTSSSNAKFPLKFCSTRWVENSRVADRLLTLFPLLKKYVNKAKELKEEPRTVSYEKMKEKLDDKFFPAKIAFFAFISCKLEVFLTEFQNDAPMIPFLYQDLAALYTQLAKLVVKSSQIGDKTDKEIFKLKITDDVLRDPKDVEIGFGTKEQVRKCSSGAVDISKKDVIIFREECRDFVVALLNKLSNLFHLTSKILRGFSFLDPSVFGSQLCVRRMNLALDEAVSVEWITGSEADKIKEGFLALMKLATVAAACSEFKKGKDRLDSFWIPIFEKEQCPRVLIQFVCRIFVLSHGQASIERGFNINKEMIVENQLEESLISQRRIYDAVGGVDISSFEVPKKMIGMVQGARRRYHDWLRIQKEKETEEERIETSKKRAAQEILLKELEKKRLRAEIETACDKIDNEISELKKMQRF